MPLRRSMALAGITALSAATLFAPAASAEASGSNALSSLSTGSSHSGLWRQISLFAGSSIKDEATLKALKFGPTSAEAAAECAAKYGEGYDWLTATCSDVEITDRAYSVALAEIPIHWNILSTGNDAVPLQGSR